MNKHLFPVAFLLGAAALIWIGSGFLGTNALALVMTAGIAAVYGLGAMELHRFRQASAALSTALGSIPEEIAHLGDWLTTVPASLRNAVRLRIDGERSGLPGPALTPYLVGLLVMLGMLGTFLGMVVTLNGAVFALEGTTDLQAIRSAFSAPIKGLGLAFGTSVAGVAASAMLGLMSALSRRERLQVSQLLDTAIATSLRSFSLTHQRQETLRVLQLQSQALPAVVSQLQAMMTSMERMSQQLNERMTGNQESFHSEVKGVYRDLADSVERSLRDALTQSAHAAGQSIKPVVEAAMTGIALESRLMHERAITSAQSQLDCLSARLEEAASTMAGSWAAALVRREDASAAVATGVGKSLDAFGETFTQRSAALVAAVKDAQSASHAELAASEGQRMQAWTGSLEAMTTKLSQDWQHAGTQTLGEITRLMASSEELIRSRATSEAKWTRQHGERMDQVASVLRAELSALREDEALRGNAAVARLGELQTALTAHLTTLGTALEDPIARLINTASEAPRAAAEVIGQLRQEISHSVARDNALLEERSRIMETLSSLLDAINHASVEQQSVIDSLVASSAVALQRAGNDFSTRVCAEAAKLTDLGAHVTASAVEVASVSETFRFAVGSFNEANEKLIANLQRIESAMDKSMARSDDQLAYYVAQAREIIDLSLLSQKEIFEELSQLPGRQAQQNREVANG
jgi:hypothetical protein